MARYSDDGLFCLHMSDHLPEWIGPYRIVRKLGEGGMGAVFEALHEAIERRVAIKVLHPEFARTPEFTGRFFNEARAVNRVDHPGLVQISDYGQLPDGMAYIVMEFLKGESLSHRLRQKGGAVPLLDVLNIAWQLADSLAAAHAKEIIHRDLKPENVMIVPDPYMPSGERTKLLDFGIAKVAQAPGAAAMRTRTNTVMGTPRYMSPEQCRGAGQVDEKSDTYSLGVMLYEMLTGRPPFEAEAPGDLMVMHIRDAPPSIRERAPDLPIELAALCETLLSKDPAVRPTMRQLAAQLAQFQKQPSQPIPIAPPVAAESGGQTTMISATGQSTTHSMTATHPNRPRLLGILSASMTLTIVPIVIAWLMTGRGSPKSDKSVLPSQLDAPRVHQAVTVPESQPETKDSESRPAASRATSQPAQPALPHKDATESESMRSPTKAASPSAHSTLAGSRTAGDAEASPRNVAPSDARHPPMEKTKRPAASKQKKATSAQVDPYDVD